MTVRTKRAYDPPSPEDGRRYLIDRQWPRGITKERLALTGWLKELAPSSELREWYGHDPARYPAFRRRFRSELSTRSELLDRLVDEARSGTITLVFAARDAKHCNAGVLQELVMDRLRAPPTSPHERLRTGRTTPRRPG